MFTFLFNDFKIQPLFGLFLSYGFITNVYTYMVVLKQYC